MRRPGGTSRRCGCRRRRAGRGRARRATAPRRSRSTACSTASRPAPGAPPDGAPDPAAGRAARRRTRRPPRAAVPRSRRRTRGSAGPCRSAAPGTTADPPAGTSRVMSAAALVPVPAGFTAPVSPCTTSRSKPSLPYGVPTVSLPVKYTGCSPRQAQHRVPSRSCVTSTTDCPAGPSIRLSTGSFPRPSDHVLRNQTVGSRRSVAASGPRLCTVIRVRMSSGPALAYSTTTSKYRSSAKIPVSSSSYSKSPLPRARLTATSSVVGELALRILVDHPHVRVRGRRRRGRSSTP